MPKVASQLWIWSVTSFKGSRDQVLTWMKANTKKFIFQQEKCPKTGSLHWQCYVNLKKKQRASTLIKSLNAAGLSGATVLAASDKGKTALAQYCMKEESRVDGPWADHPIYRGQDLPKTLRPWQQEICNMVKTEPHPRSIHWYYDAVGGAGKTVLAKYMYYHHKVLTLTVGKASDLLNLVSKMPGLPMYIFDISRTVPTGSMNELYHAIESVKNGYLVNTKYETNVLIFERPHVVVFSNMLPKMSALSGDRWEIHDMSQVSQDN